MIARAYTSIHSYPRQFWLMFTGMLISTVGASMIWPFLMIYASEKLHVPLTAAASLMAYNSFAGLVSSFIAGPFIDRFGRKWTMVASLALNGVNYLFLGQANSYLAFALLMVLSGSVNPLYRVGSDAMMADLLPEEKRPDGYALMRMSNNLGVAIGPAVGGFIATQSYTLSFIFAAIGMMSYSILLGALAKETLPRNADDGNQPATRSRFGGYPEIFRHKEFTWFALSFTMVAISAAFLWLLLPVYAKQNYHVPENQYGFLPTTNAAMIVALQIAVTKRTKKLPALPLMAAGGLLYALGVGSIALGRGFWGFWISMIIMTFGELILMPTSSTHAANLAPPDMRGRYMSLYGLSWGLAIGIGPVIGGFLNDFISPTSTWYGGFIFGLAGALGFLTLFIRNKRSNLESGTIL